MSSEELLREMKKRFPWLGTDDEAMPGDTIDGLNDWYRELADDETRALVAMRVKVESMLTRMNRQYGAGDVIAVVWEPESYAGVHRANPGGVVVTVLQYGTAHGRFTVNGNRGMVKYKGREWPLDGADASK